MLELRKGVDILTAVGGVETLEQARAVLRESLDAENYAKLEHIRTEGAWLRIANAVAMCTPDNVMVVTPSAADQAKIRELALSSGEEKELAMPGHRIHFDLPEEQGRIVDRTFYIVNPGERTSVLARKMLRDEAHAYVADKMSGIMAGKTMFVGFFNRGPAGASATIPAIQVSSSTYVMHSGDLLYRNAYETFDSEVDRRGTFLTNVHSEGPWRAEDLQHARVFMDRAWLTTFSMFCTYAGNTLLLKKGNHRFAVDLATYFGKGRELSEHMFVTGMEGPGGRTTWFAGAAPSGCGKTTTAMAGSSFVGDDLAQMWIADGTVRAVNPEKGIFGIVRDVNREGDPYLMKCLREEGTEVIWSNVLVDDAGVPHWVGNGEDSPDSGTNFQGAWTKGMVDAKGKPVPMSHPNARCTIDARAIANFDDESASDPAGVPVKVVTYSGRDSDTMPPIWVAHDADEGVVIGASIVSAATATEIGASGVRRQPWANEPFIPGPLADYLGAQFAFWGSDELAGGGRPIMAGINYFLTHAARGSSGTGLLGEKRDVKVWLGWLELRAHGDVEALDTPIGLLPHYADLKRLFAEKLDKEYTRELYDMQFSLYIDPIVARIDLQCEAYGKEEGLPQTLLDIYGRQREALLALKGEVGAIVPPTHFGG